MLTVHTGWLLGQLTEGAGKLLFLTTVQPGVHPRVDSVLEEGEPIPFGQSLHQNYDHGAPNFWDAVKKYKVWIVRSDVLGLVIK